MAGIGAGGVYTPGRNDDNFVPTAYDNDKELYNGVIKHYCRTCHIAQGPNLGTPEAINATARSYVFSTYIMPHAERTSHLIWTGSGPALLANSRGWSLRVTRLDDPEPDGCSPGDCSLREAIRSDESLAMTSSQLRCRRCLLFDSFPARTMMPSRVTWISLAA
jgi:hypothetical protein